VGDNVVVEPYFVDDDCDMCQAGSYHLCRQMGFIGLSGGGGGLSEKIVVDKRWVHPIGDIPLDEAALIEPLSVAHHAVARSGAKAGDVALVGGSGPIGLLTAAVLKGLGVTTVISELTQARKEKAVSSGVADHVLDPSQEDVPARVLELTGGTGADVAFECAGVNAVLDTMLDAVRPGGVVVNVSIWGAPATVDMQKLVLKEIDLRGTIAYVRDHPAVIKMVQEGKVDLKPFITGRIALDDLVEQGFDTLINHKDTAVKVLVHP
jgi:(R,R)-butanediol dehydrogenase/meso-butanediol dehydrogenase/diacetyl reductase